jgi:hypothetical protein
MATSETSAPADEEMRSASEAVPVARVSLTPPDALLPRLAAFIVFLVIGHAWLVAHFTFNLLTVLGYASLIAVAGALTKILPKGRIAAMRAEALRLLYAMLRTPVLLSFYVLLVIAGSLVGSVHVLAAGAQGIGGVEMSAADGAPLRSGWMSGPESAEHFVLITNPFGRELSLHATHYRRYSFALYPWVPKRIRVSDTMRVAPTLLLRIDPKVIPRLAETKLRLYSGKMEIGTFPVAAAPAAVHAAGAARAVLVGPERRIPEERVGSWERYIERAGVATSASAFIDDWLRPVKMRTTTEIYVGMKLKAVLMKGDKRLASTEFVVSADPLQDILLLKERETTSPEITSTATTDEIPPPPPDADADPERTQ